MAEELQQLLEKIQKDGVDKANAEAKAILAKANEEAAATEAKAREAAEAASAKAASDAETYAKRAEETIRQAARDIVIQVGDSVTALLEGFLKKDVDAALSSEEAASLALDAVKQLIKGDSQAEVAANARLADLLRSQLSQAALAGAVKVTVDESIESGFSVRIDNGRVEHDFSGAAVASELARRLRPDLAALVK